MGKPPEPTQGDPVRWTHSRETTGCPLPRSSLQVGRKCTRESAGHRGTLADGRDLKRVLRDLEALRCFRVKSKDEAGQDIVRWFFARQLTDDLWTLREAKTLEPLQVHLLEDFAPRTKAAKQVQQLAFGAVPTSPKNQRKSANARARPGTRETRRIDYALFCETWRELTHFPLVGDLKQVSDDVSQNMGKGDVDVKIPGGLE